MTTSAFKPLTEAEQVFKDLVWGPLILAGQSALIAVEAPVTGIPIVGWILTTAEKEAISLIGDFLFNQLILFIDVTAIKFVNAAHQAKFDDLSEKLEVIATDYGATSPEYLKARDNEAQAFANFVRPSIG